MDEFAEKALVVIFLLLAILSVAVVLASCGG